MPGTLLSQSFCMTVLSAQCPLLIQKASFIASCGVYVQKTFLILLLKMVVSHSILELPPSGYIALIALSVCFLLSFRDRNSSSLNPELSILGRPVSSEDLPVSINCIRVRDIHDHTLVFIWVLKIQT